MQINSSYKAKILGVNRSLDNTINIYRNALSYIIDVVNKEWANISLLSTSKEQYNYVEKLIHTTIANLAPYDFDLKFYKYPSYLRRSTTADAVGIVSSYNSNLDNYNKEKYKAISNGKSFKKKPPKLQLKHFKCPALYKGNMFLLLDNNKAMIKIYNGSDWVWLKVALRHQDVKYINKAKGKISSPILTKSGRGYSLRFCLEDNVKLNNIKLKMQKIVAVDLGLNHSAVCSLMSYDGTVTKRLIYLGVIIIYDIDTNMLRKLSEKMGLKFVRKDDDVAIDKMMEISKPNRPEVREFFQRQLESIRKDETKGED